MGFKMTEKEHNELKIKFTIRALRDLIRFKSEYKLDSNVKEELKYIISKLKQ